VTTLLLVRHGETDWNAERRWQGHADVPLNERGRSQALTLAEELVGEGRVDAVYASDLARARETGEIVSRRLGLDLVLDRDLREIDVGSREGRTWTEIDDQPEWDGEPSNAHASRVLRALLRIAQAHDGGRVLVVTHGGSMRRVHEHLGLESLRITNCSVWACVVEDGIFRLSA
jgi:2,3-bisphosphoglycerate-dependent phosphoglycerate mutase